MLCSSPARSRHYQTFSRFQFPIIAYSPAVGILRLRSALPQRAGLWDTPSLRKDLGSLFQGPPEFRSRAPVLSWAARDYSLALWENPGWSRLTPAPSSPGRLSGRACGPRWRAGAEAEGRAGSLRRLMRAGPGAAYVTGPLMLLSWSMEPKLKEEIILLMLSSPNPHLSLPWSPALASKGLERAPDF